MKQKYLVWIGSSLKDLRNLPKDVVDKVGYALYLAQIGKRHKNTKVLHGFGGTDVIEIRETDVAGTYRAVYTVKMIDMIFVLHVFQKKSKQGIKTPQPDIELIKRRLKQAQEIYKEHQKQGKTV
jgi:phage-related protein